MADANPDLDLGGAPQGDQEQQKGGNLKLIIIVAVAALALGAGAAWFMVPKPEVSEAGDAAETEQVADAESTAGESAEPAPEPIYYDLGQDFVSNLKEGGLMRMKASVMSYDQAVIDKVTYNKAAIVHEILSLLRAQTQANLSTTDGQEALRTAIKDKIQSIIRRSDGDPGVEEVYITDFILQ
ncbi:flagellar basal body-associated FliL family protein [bacterium SCSIO 12696]|nr:flagellar basal body-associated FliL family protein [bacterium SCSIO 12696]